MAITAFGSEEEGLMYSNDKIYVVVGVLVIIFVVIAAYLFSLDRRIGQIEKENEA